MWVSELPADEKQIVEILKAVSVDPRILILDEATASLDSRQVQRLFDLIKTWKAEGKAIIFVSHRMEEIFRIADRYSVLRNGKTVGAGDIKDVTENDLVKLMIDKDSVFSFSRAGGKKEEKPVCLEVKDLNTRTLARGEFQCSRRRTGRGGRPARPGPARPAAIPVWRYSFSAAVFITTASPFISGIRARP